MFLVVKLEQKKSNRKLNALLVFGGLAIVTLCTVLTPAHAQTPYVPIAATKVDGISDQVMERWTPASAAAADGLQFHYARLVVSWDVVNRPEELAKVNSWLAVAAARHYYPMISFGWIDPYKYHVVPSIAVYTEAVGAFVASHPAVREYTAFNEADDAFRYAIKAEPAKQYTAATSPSRITAKQAADYYVALRSVSLGAPVIAGDFNMPKTIVSYASAYYKILGTKGFQPTIAFHGFEGSATLAQVQKKLPPGTNIWDTEAALFAGVDQLKRTYSVLCHPIASRTYVYELNNILAPKQGWDSALLDNDVPRPAYNVLLQTVQNPNDPTICGKPSGNHIRLRSMYRGP